MTPVLSDLTVCVPTFRRARDLEETLATLLDGTHRPAEVLVSEADSGAMARTAQVISQVASRESASGVSLRLLPAAPNPALPGNKNWLARHVQTPFLMFLDDDLSVEPDVLAKLSTPVRVGQADIVFASLGPPPSWLTRRGHMRSALPGEPVIVTLAAACMPSSLALAYTLDELIIYGHEESDFSLRVHSASTRVLAAQCRVHDRGAASESDPERLIAANESRAYVASKRYRGRPLKAVSWLLLEVASNTARGRRPLPRPLIKGQYRRMLLGADHT